MQPLVSVIIPTYNRSELLKRAAESVLNQTFTNLECIIVDDASTDNTKDIVTEFDDDRIIYLKHEENKHVSAARNTGINRAQGKYVAFLDDDDMWLPTKLERQVQLLESLDETVGFVYCWMNYYDGDTLVQERLPTLRGDIFEKALASQPIGNASTLLVRKKCIEDIGGFDTNLLRGNDGDFIRRLCHSYKVDYIPEVLVKYFVNHGKKRITRSNEEGIRRNIIGQKAKLEKFGNLNLDFPKQYSSILANIAASQCQLQNYKEAMTTFLEALKTSPFNFKIYRKILVSIKFIISKLFKDG